MFKITIVKILIRSCSPTPGIEPGPPNDINVRYLSKDPWWNFTTCKLQFDLNETMLENNGIVGKNAIQNACQFDATAAPRNTAQDSTLWNVVVQDRILANESNTSRTLYHPMTFKWNRVTSPRLQPANPHIVKWVQGPVHCVDHFKDPGLDWRLLNRF